jgi:hypothetical protein
MSAKQPRELPLQLSFLGAGRYTARIRKDAAESDPNHLPTETLNLSSADTLKIHLALDGGFVALWSEQDGFIDLNSLVPTNSGWVLKTAAAINEYGQITGFGYFQGQDMPCRLDIVPEPSMWAFFGLGGVGLWLFSRRRD